MSAPVWKSMSAKAYRAYRKRGKAAKALYDAALKNKYKPNGKTAEIIGLVSASFTHITTDAVPGTLTQTTFDTTSRADSAQILLTNSTGGGRTIIAAWIRGKPVTRFSSCARGMWSGTAIGGSGSMRPALVLGGFLHDKFVDYEAQARDGDVTFETGNNFVVTADQTNQLADYYWKLHRTKKHIYTLSLVGFQSWFEPGEWYTLQIGGAGEAEYIDSTVECFDVRCSLSAGSAPSTSVSFREVEENWKFDSNEVARQIAAGNFNRRPILNYVTVAPQLYSGYADYYCDGDDDQVEINSALSHLNEIGGGELYLPGGTYDISSSVTLFSNASVRGDGNSTQLNVDRPITYVIKAEGSSGAYIENVSIRNVMLNNNSYGYANTGVRAVCIKNFVFENNYILGMTSGVAAYAMKPGFIRGNTIEAARTGINIQETATSYSSIFVSGNELIDCTDYDDSNDSYGILAVNVTASNVNNITITGNKVSGTQAGASGLFAYGIKVSGWGVVTANNRVTNGNTIGTSTAYGYFVATGSTSCVMANNYAYNNGLDTGMANTNSNNFKDNGTDTQWAG